MTPARTYPGSSAAAAGPAPAREPATEYPALALTMTRPGRRPVHQARGQFRDCLAGWGTGSAAGDAEQVFAEVTANAAQHSRRRIRIRVWRAPGYVRCAVRDSSRRVPHPPPREDPGREDGRGLDIISALADDWGVRRHLLGLLGKTVWFVVNAGEADTKGALTQ